MPRFFRTPFAENGDRQEIPYVSATTEVSYSSGYTPEYEFPKTNPDRRNIDRQPFNGVLRDVTENIKYFQENAFPEIVSDRGDGQPVQYPKGFIGSLSGVYYQAVSETTTTVPPSADWIVYEDYQSNISKRVGNAVMGVKTQADIDIDGVLEITPEDGSFITLDWDGDTDLEITGFGDQLPVGYTFDIYIPRTIGNTGGTANTLGNKVAFLHTATGDGLDLELNLRMDEGSELYTYEAYSNACDALGNRGALYERLTYMEVGSGRQRLINMPEDTTCQNANGRWSLSSIGVVEMYNNNPITVTSTSDSQIVGVNYPMALSGLDYTVGFESQRRGTFGNFQISTRDGDFVDSLFLTRLPTLQVSSGSGASLTNSEIRGVRWSVRGRWKPSV